MKSAVLVEPTLPAVVHRDEEWWIADCPALDVCTQGHTREEAMVNLEDAVVFFIESCFERGRLFDILCEAGFERASDEQVTHPAREEAGDALSVRVPLPFLVVDRGDRDRSVQQS